MVIDFKKRAKLRKYIVSQSATLQTSLKWRLKYKTMFITAGTEHPEGYCAMMGLGHPIRILNVLIFLQGDKVNQIVQYSIPERISYKPIAFIFE